MKELKEAVEKLVSEELERSNKKFPMFHSQHEGYAVIKEEIEEVNNEVRECGCNLGYLWDSVKEDDTFNALDEAENIYYRAISIAAEAIQVAAMAQKYKDSFKGE